MPNILIIPGRGEYEFIQKIDELTYDLGLRQEIQLIKGLAAEFKPSIVSAASSIIAWLKRNDPSGARPKALEWFSRSQSIILDQNTLLALQIITDESHPNMHLPNHGPGLCLKTILNRCKSSAGKTLVKHWITNPLNDKALIENRQMKIEQLLRIQQKTNIIGAIQECLRGLLLIRFLKGASELHRLLKVHQTESQDLMEDMDHILLGEIHTTITGIIDFVQSRAQGRIVIRSKVNSELDQLRKRYVGLPEYLASNINEIASRITNTEITTINIVYFPQLGFLVTVPLSKELAPNSIGEGDFELQFKTEKVAYYKERTTRNLDNEIGDVFADMVDMEIEIVRVLCDQLAPHCSTLAKYENMMAEFDCIQSFASVALEDDLVRPEITNDLDLEIVGGSVVSNDCSLKGEKVMILTGPNSSGKSVYMKQTSSAFQTDLLQIKQAIECCTERSLVLIDEFGKGTIPNDGIALFCGLARYLASKDDCPRTLAITHFHEIYQKELVPRELFVKWCTMDLLEGEGGKVVFLYKVVPGKAQSSLGICCARAAGIQQRILDRAEVLLKLYSAKVPSIDIRYAQVDPKLEQLAIGLIKSTEEDVPIETLRAMATALIHKQN